MEGGKVFVYTLLMLIVVMASMVSSFAAAQGMVEGILAKAVILIRNIYGLQNMSKNLNADYALANDIDAFVTKNWNNGSGFAPIGHEGALFNGTFDGRSIIYNQPEGLFGNTTGNVILENVALINISVSRYFGWAASSEPTVVRWTTLMPLVQ